MGLMDVALSGLRAAQAGLQTTGNNVSNVNTPGYTRQQIVQTAAVAQFTGAGYVGKGVNVTSITRIYGNFLTQSLRDATAAGGASDAYATQASQLDTAVADSSSNVSTSIDTFFSSVQAVANAPSDSASRQTMLSTARSMVSRFNDLNDRIQSQATDVDQQINDTVSTINTVAQQIATLNTQIANAGSQAPNDLLDQRDSLTQQLAGAIGGTVIPQNDGSASVYLASGQPLVLENSAFKVSTVPDAQNGTKIQLAVTMGNTTTRLDASQISQGTVGGLLKFRDEVLEPAQNALGRVAIALGSAINAQNALGQDANGNAGGPLFTVASPLIVPRASNSTGSNVSATITDATKLTGADYTLDYDGTNYTVKNLSDNTTHSYSSLPQTLDGFQISLGTMAAGDHFTISPTRNGARDIAVTTTDPAMIAAAAPVALTTGSSNTGTAQLASLSVVPTSSLPANLRSPVNIVFHVTGSTTTYDVVDATSGTAISSGNAYNANTTITQNGWSLSFSGTPANGDTFTVGPNTGGTGDSRNALLLAAVQTSTASTPVGSVQDAYNGMVSLVGNQTAEGKALQTSNASVLTQAQDDRDSLSGVNLDEEAVNMQKYQQAYQASAKSIAVAQAMFQSILDVFAAVTS